MSSGEESEEDPLYSMEEEEDNLNSMEEIEVNVSFQNPTTHEEYLRGIETIFILFLLFYPLFY
jgi:hypothetical protein